MQIAAFRAIPAICVFLGLTVAVGCHRDPAAKEARFIAHGKKLMEEKDYQRAALEFSNAAKLNATRAETWHQMGTAYLGAGRLREGVAALRRALELDPSLVAAQLKLSALMVQSGDPAVLDAAVKRLDQVLLKQADDPEALDLMATAKLKLNQPEDAEKNLRQALEKFPGHLKSSAVLAALQFSRKDFDAAEKTLQAAVAKAPQSTDAALALAQLYFLEKKTGPAEEQIRRALQIDGTNSAPLLALARLQISQGKLDDAEQTYQKAASLPKTNVPFAHTDFLLGQRKADQAIGELERLAKSAATEREAQLRLISANRMAGREPAAVAVLDSMLKKNPKDSAALLIRSDLKARSGKTSEAEADLQEVLHFNADSAEAHYGLARVYGATGRDRMREKELFEAVRLRPDLFTARVELARMQIAAGHAETGLETLDAAPPRQKTVSAFIAERNWALFALKRTDEASAALSAALESQNDPKLILQRGLLKYNKKDYAGAREDAASAARQNPHDLNALNLLIQADLAQKKNGDAIEAARVAAKDGNDPAMQVYAGQWLARLGKNDDARGVFAAAGARPGGYTPAEVSAALLEVGEGKTAEAKARLLAVIRKEPQNDAALLLLADIEYTAKNYAGALPYLRTVADLRPTNVAAVNGTAYLLAATDVGEALKYAEAALALAPDNPMVQDTVGWVYYRKGDPAKAVRYLETAVARGPSTVREFHLAMAYIKSGDRARGAKLLDAVLAKDPNVMKTEQGW